MFSETLTDHFVRRFGRSPARLVRAPGRLNILGGHTDYNHGLALPGAIDRSIGLAIQDRADRQVQIYSVEFDALLRFSLDDIPKPNGGWQGYVLGALDVFPETPAAGFDAIIHGDVPHGSGLSSSAALLVAWMLALQASTNAPLSKLDLCRLCQQVEHQHMGVQCGLLDPIGSLLPVANSVVRVDFADLSVRPVDARFDGLAWVVLHTGVHRELADSGYGDRVAECARALARVQASHPTVRTIRDITPDMLPDATPEMRRVRHIIAENTRVERAVQALESDQPDALGALLQQAHDSLRDDYAVSCPELDALVELAAAHPAWLGGRMMGGGFGGCTAHLVQRDGAEELIAQVLAAYHQRFPHRGRGFTVQLVGGAQVSSGPGAP